MPANSWKLAPGLNNVGSYQVSGRPFASGGIEARRSSSNSLVVRFPHVTSWFQIIPRNVQAGVLERNNLRIAFSENGLHNINYFVLDYSGSIARTFEIKTSELWFMENSNIGAFEFDLVAGLTNIPASRTAIPEDRTVDGVVKAAGPNYTGSIGVG